MASYTKRGRTWRAQVRKNGVRRTATFDRKSDAKTWASKVEAELDSGSHVNTKISCRSLFEKYEQQICPQHKGERWERVRLAKLGEVFGEYAAADLVNTDVLAKWKEKRLREVKPGTVRREMVLLNQVFEVAVNEWRLIHVNPLRGVKKPKAPKARERVITPAELEAVWDALGYTDGGEVLTKQQQVGLALHIALETAMRAGEILATKPIRGKVIHIPDSKNGFGRDVPLSKKARELVQRIPKGGFAVGTAELSVLFGKARKRCGFPNGDNGGFTFHDSRANALTMLSKKLDVLALAKMVGHRDPRSLLIYYRETPEEVADRL
jgi:integrase